ncbi:MAG: sporulation protein YabP [Oscillospiraceae bacterium]|nr:sporulation protein YabP [Oscillospiraceae bacterium]
MKDGKNVIRLPHNIILEDRKKLIVSGVIDIDSFDESLIVAFTDMGDLNIKGKDLHINKLNVETGELSVEGDIFALIYSDDTKRDGGFFSKLFK